MRVTTWTLEMKARPADGPRAFPDGVRLDRVTEMTPEYARFLYGLVGGPWFWVDRLAWSRDLWAEEIEVAGTEFYVLYGEGSPLGYVQLRPELHDAESRVEVRYFGLAEQGLGRALGGVLLEHGVDAAWTLAERHDLAPVGRVWVHTCTLDGPAALTNYQARGFTVTAEEETEEDFPEQSPGSWVATGGPAT